MFEHPEMFKVLSFNFFVLANVPSFYVRLQEFDDKRQQWAAARI